MLLFFSDSAEEYKTLFTELKFSKTFLIALSTAPDFALKILSYIFSEKLSQKHLVLASHSLTWSDNFLQHMFLSWISAN
jgi:hypothetical protein